MHCEAAGDANCSRGAVCEMTHVGSQWSAQMIPWALGQHGTRLSSGVRRTGSRCPAINNGGVARSSSPQLSSTVYGQQPVVNTRTTLATFLL